MKRKRRTKLEMEAYRLSKIPSKANENALESVQNKNEGDSEGFILKGFINVCRSPKTRYAAEWYYIGGDIHETIEKANKVASNTTVGQVYIEFHVKDR